MCQALYQPLRYRVEWPQKAWSLPLNTARLLNFPFLLTNQRHLLHQDKDNLPLTFPFPLIRLIKHSQPDIHTHACVHTHTRPRALQLGDCGFWPNATAMLICSLLNPGLGAQDVHTAGGPGAQDSSALLCRRCFSGEKSHKVIVL